MSRVLVVDDQPNVRRSMAMLLEQQGHAVTEAGSVAVALEAVSSDSFDVLVTDMRIDGPTDGVVLVKEARARDRDIEVVLITAFGSIEDAVEAIRAGAYDYLTKPADPDRLTLTVRRAAERSALSREVRSLRVQVGENTIVAVSPQMQTVLSSVARLAASDSTVLLTGESGTGKELVARALHRQGDRADRRFVPINCGAVPETMLETELFGHRKGSFTGAVFDKKGLLEEADRGVLFLDEIGDMPAAMQVRLLRFLQGGEVRRIGDTATRLVDVRLITATHRALEHEVAQGRFRQDFYYRINVVAIHIPPLRERVDDIAPLAEVFLRRTNARLRRRVEGISPGALGALQAYAWPGNARELENVIERAVNLSSGSMLTEADLPASVTLQPIDAGRHQGDERAQLVTALEEARWNHGRAAATLGMSRSTLWRKMREHRIES